jgi:hypothetical protein
MWDVKMARTMWFERQVELRHRQAFTIPLADLFQVRWRQRLALRTTAEDAEDAEVQF